MPCSSWRGQGAAALVGSLPDRSVTAVAGSLPSQSFAAVAGSLVGGSFRRGGLAHATRICPWQPLAPGSTLVYRLR